MKRIIIFISIFTIIFIIIFSLLNYFNSIENNESKNNLKLDNT